jgi:hypothetical protein
MQWSDLPLKPSRHMLRQFAALWLVFFGAVALWQGVSKDRLTVGIALGAIAIIGGGCGLVRPNSIRWLFVGWMIAAFPIGWVISQVVLAVCFYVILTPVGLVFRLMGRDVLNLKPHRQTNSYWEAKPRVENVGNYFRQY